MRVRRFGVVAPAVAGLTALAALALLAGPAAAQSTDVSDPSLYRDGQPQVLTAPPQGPAEGALDEGAVGAAFSAAYEAEGAPRIAVFWNRAFSDRLSQWTALTRAVASEQGRITGTLFDTENNALIQGNETAQVEVLTPESARAGFETERADMAFESAYVTPIQANGARIIDRATVMRLTQSEMRNDEGLTYRPDAQLVETDALINYADLIAEILMVRDPEADLGAAFRVQVKDVRTGELVITFLSRGEAPARTGARREWVATGSGFQPRADKAPTPEDVARRLAFETMQRLAGRWGV
ncbi:MAG: hypothetical protein RIB45_16930 [Marivibrio sp.]|uniref:hypothetical protein n=1 Tax=Marivibrio sp. TaxID=2039719 RepID=UPI0032ED7D0A